MHNMSLRLRLLILRFQIQLLFPKARKSAELWYIIPPLPRNHSSTNQLNKISYGAWDNSASMKAPASNPRLKNTRARTQTTKDYQVRVQPSLGSPIVKASSSFILGIEPLRCCDKKFKTENDMQQHKRDSPAHPEIHAHHASTKATRRGEVGYSYGLQEYTYSSSDGGKGDNFGLCDTDCGWCGHCADNMDF